MDYFSSLTSTLTFIEKAEIYLPKPKNSKMKGLESRARRKVKKESSKWLREWIRVRTNQMRSDLISECRSICSCFFAFRVNEETCFCDSCNQLTNSLANNISLDESARRDENSPGLRSHALSMETSYFYSHFSSELNTITNHCLNQHAAKHSLRVPKPDRDLRAALGEPVS